MRFLTVISEARSPDSPSGEMVMNADEIRSLQRALAALLEEFRPCFPRERTFAYWHSYLAGMEPDRDALPGRPDAAASEGRLRRSPWSRSPT